MTRAKFEYLAPDDLRLADICALLHGIGRLRLVPPTTFPTVFYDTFDWALHDEGGALALEGVAPSLQLLWLPFDEQETPVVQNVSGLPGRLADLEDGPVRERIAAVCGRRRLVSMMRIESEAQRLQLLEDEDQVAVCVRLVTNTCRDPRTGTTHDLRKRVEVLPNVCSESTLAQVEQRLDDASSLWPSPPRLLMESLVAVGRQPNDYSAGLALEFPAQVRAEAAAMQTLRALSAILTANLPGVKERLDDEFLHDLRRTTRRIRTLLTVFRGVLPEDRVAYFHAYFTWMEKISDIARNLDVHLQGFETYRQAVSEELRPHLACVAQTLGSGRQREQERLLMALSSESFERLSSEWQEFLAMDASGHPVGAGTPVTVQDFADAGILRLVRKMRREGGGLSEDSHRDDLQRVRKVAKKVDTLFEAFACLYPREDVMTLRRLLGRVIDDFGAFQDLSMQIRQLTDLARRLRARDPASPETQHALLTVIHHLLERQQQMRAASLESLRNYLADGTQERLRQLFQTRPVDSVSASSSSLSYS